MKGGSYSFQPKTISDKSVFFTVTDEDDKNWKVHFDFVSQIKEGPSSEPQIHTSKEVSIEKEFPKGDGSVAHLDRQIAKYHDSTFMKMRRTAGLGL